MAWYVRVKSKPSLCFQEVPQNPSKPGKNGRISTSFPISLEDDLSEVSFPHEIGLHVQIYEFYSLTGRCYPLGQPSEHVWTPAMYPGHTIKISPEWLIPHVDNVILNSRESGSCVVDCIMLRVSVQNPNLPANMKVGIGSRSAVPIFVDSWVGEYTIQKLCDPPCMNFQLDEDRAWLQRRLLLPGPEQPGHVVAESDQHLVNHTTAQHSEPPSSMLVGAKPELHLWEDVGESIARHVWDGGVGFASYLAAHIHPETPLNALSVLLRDNAPRAISREGAHELRILELGAGIGSAGLALAHLLPTPSTRIVLTDLPDAQKILRTNVEEYFLYAKTATHTKADVRCATLDWAAVAASPEKEMSELARALELYGEQPISGSEQSTLNAGARAGLHRGGRSRGSQRRYKVPPRRFSAESARKPAHVERQFWDLILVSDCIYNETSLPALVATLAAACRFDREEMYNHGTMAAIAGLTIRSRNLNLGKGYNDKFNAPKSFNVNEEVTKRGGIRKSSADCDVGASYWDTWKLNSTSHIETSAAKDVAKRRNSEPPVELPEDLNLTTECDSSKAMFASKPKFEPSSHIKEPVTEPSQPAGQETILQEVTMDAQRSPEAPPVSRHKTRRERQKFRKLQSKHGANDQPRSELSAETRGKLKRHAEASLNEDVDPGEASPLDVSMRMDLDKSDLRRLQKKLGHSIRSPASTGHPISAAEKAPNTGMASANSHVHSRKRALATPTDNHALQKSLHSPSRPPVSETESESDHEHQRRTGKSRKWSVGVTPEFSRSVPEANKRPRTAPEGGEGVSELRAEHQDQLARQNPGLVPEISNKLRVKGTLVAVARKWRHDAESKFFELMEQEGFKMVLKESVPMRLDDSVPSKDQDENGKAQGKADEDAMDCTGMVSGAQDEMELGPWSSMEEESGRFGTEKVVNIFLYRYDPAP